MYNMDNLSHIEEQSKHNIDTENNDPTYNNEQSVDGSQCPNINDLRGEDYSLVQGGVYRYRL